jgi:cysteine-rich repeat protein
VTGALARAYAWIVAALLASACFYQPSGSSPGEESTSTETSTAEPTTAEPTAGDPCDEDGECDPGEDVEGCPADCDGPPACGDSAIEGDEVCDDGADNGMYGFCNGDCTAQIGCGDGAVNGDEVCDDGPLNSDEYSPEPHCNADCSGQGPTCGDAVCQADVEHFNNCPEDCDAVCGNGVEDPGEGCDDGDGAPMDSADCDADCTVVECGDETINSAAGETCDDGNALDSDACPSSCVAAFCGDGYVQSGVEACDDGDATNDDACGVDCVLPRIVFVSAETVQGALSGVAGADLLCDLYAANAGMEGESFRAWLSDAATGPADRFDAEFTGAYKLIDGTVVAGEGWQSLTSGSLAHAIDRNATGGLVGGTAWTNTLVDGTPASADDCMGWTTTSGTGAVGGVAEVDAQWTDLGGGQFCNSPMHLYCFEDLS